ncbi:TlpA family protein disulfide reductase, partial [Polaribacter reichenbachii]
QLKLIDSLIKNNDKSIKINSIRDEINYRYYLAFFRDLQATKSHSILDSLYDDKYVNKKILLNSNFKIEYIKNFVTSLSIHINDKKISYNPIEVNNKLDTYFNNEDLKIARKFSVINITFKNIDTGRIYYNRYMEEYDDLDFKSYYNYLLKNLSESRDKPVEIKTNFNLNITSLDNEKGVSLNKIIKENKGKVILIDFWASWCKPCRISFPSVNKLIKEYSNKDFTCIFLSIDVKKDKWKKAVKKEKLTNYKNSYVVSGKNKDFMKQINLKYIPRYILINKNGEIVAPYAPKPKSKDLRNLIDKYLK